MIASTQASVRLFPLLLGRVLGEDLERLAPEILLPHDVGLADRKRKTAGLAIFGRVGDDPELVGASEPAGVIGLRLLLLGVLGDDGEQIARFRNRLVALERRKARTLERRRVGVREGFLDQFDLLVV